MGTKILFAATMKTVTGSGRGLLTIIIIRYIRVNTVRSDLASNLVTYLKRLTTHRNAQKNGLMLISTLIFLFGITRLIQTGISRVLPSLKMLMTGDSNLLFGNSFPMAKYWH